jgi:hypothetical protein
MRPICAAIVLTTVLAPSLGAQERQVKSNFAPADLVGLEGNWVLDVMRSGLTPAEAERRVMKVGPTWLRLDIYRPKSTEPIALIYNLDGSENVNAFGPDTAVTRLSRDGERVVLETVFTVNKQAVTMRELLPLVPKGFDLSVEVVLRVEHGYQGVAPPGPAGSSRMPPNISNATKIFQKQI